MSSVTDGLQDAIDLLEQQAQDYVGEIERLKIELDRAWREVLKWRPETKE